VRLVKTVTIKWLKEREACGKHTERVLEAFGDEKIPLTRANLVFAVNKDVRVQWLWKRVLSPSDYKLNLAEIKALVSKHAVELQTNKRKVDKLVKRFGTHLEYSVAFGKYCNRLANAHAIADFIERHGEG
jgi:hypothetical protein